MPPQRRGPKPKKSGALAKLATRVQEALEQGEEVTIEKSAAISVSKPSANGRPLAIARTTPLLLALFSLVCLIVHRLRDCWPFLPRSTAWYLKSQATFSDLLALVRRTIWADANYVKSTICDDQVIISRQDWERVLSQLASTA